MRNRYLARISSPNCQTRASTQAVQAPKGTTLDGQQQSCTIGKMERCRQLLRRAKSLNWERILFADEKLYTIEQANNHQNGRRRRAEAPGTSGIVDRRKKSKVRDSLDRNLRHR